MMQKLIGIVLFVAAVAAFIALMVVVQPAISTIRDIVIIAFGIGGILILLVILLIVIAIYFKLGPVFEAVQKSLGTVQGTMNTIQGTTVMFSDLVMKPVVRGTSFFVGVRQGVRVTRRVLKWRK